MKIGCDVGDQVPSACRVAGSHRRGVGYCLF